MPDHLSLPLRVRSGSFETVTIGSDVQVEQALAVLLSTHPGERLSVPDYGVPDLTFSPNIDASIVQRAVKQWEPRAGDVAISISRDGESVILDVSGG